MMTKEAQERVVACALQVGVMITDALPRLRQDIREHCRIETGCTVSERHANAILAYVLSRNIVRNECLAVVDSMTELVTEPEVGKERER
jgi:hypothetical protein